mmetsp:Transcript_34101/g.87965  ORF Transcript_34101/g.87965 Transcript_34101/m.87965 type:complete len:223 (-) Transcript_34101:1166-1834(-)
MIIATIVSAFATAISTLSTIVTVVVAVGVVHTSASISAVCAAGLVGSEAYTAWKRATSTAATRYPHSVRTHNGAVSVVLTEVFLAYTVSIGGDFMTGSSKTSRSTNLTHRAIFIIKSNGAEAVPLAASGVSPEVAVHEANAIGSLISPVDDIDASLVVFNCLDILDIGHVSRPRHELVGRFGVHIVHVHFFISQISKVYEPAVWKHCNTLGIIVLISQWLEV